VGEEQEEEERQQGQKGQRVVWRLQQCQPSQWCFYALFVMSIKPVETAIAIATATATTALAV
jgi:hypothetical protein